MNRPQYHVALAVLGLLIMGGLMGRIPIAEAQGFGIVNGKQPRRIPLTTQWRQNWRQLRVGMPEAQVYKMLGDWKWGMWSAGIAGIMPASRTYHYWRKDYSKGFERTLWFEVRFRYDQPAHCYRAVTKGVDWITEKFEGASEYQCDGWSAYNHFDVSDEFQ